MRFPKYIIPSAEQVPSKQLIRKAIAAGIIHISDTATRNQVRAALKNITSYDRPAALKEAA